MAPATSVTTPCLELTADVLSVHMDRMLGKELYSVRDVFSGLIALLSSILLWQIEYLPLEKLPMEQNGGTVYPYFTKSYR